MQHQEAWGRCCGGVIWWLCYSAAFLLCTRQQKLCPRCSDFQTTSSGSIQGLWRFVIFFETWGGWSTLKTKERLLEWNCTLLCILFFHCSWLPIFLPNLKGKPLNETPLSFFVMQCGSGPSCAFAFKIFHVKAPLFFVCCNMQLAEKRSLGCLLSSSHSSFSLAIIKFCTHVCRCTVQSAEKSWITST